jgi:molecular chaperone GrpE
MEKDDLSVPQPSPGGAESVEGNNREKETAAAGSPEVSTKDLPADLPAAYEKLRAERDALYERLLRKQAEIENIRKRTQREKEDFLQHATADLVRALLPALDGFERALKQRHADVPPQFYEGMELIYRDLKDVLSRAGLSPVETVGRHFDPHVHQAVETVEASGHGDQEIVEEFQRGYRLRKALNIPRGILIYRLPRNPLTRRVEVNSRGRSLRTNRTRSWVEP